jgi:hypothetical protein
MHVYVYTLCKLLNEGAISLCCSNIVDVSSYEELKEAIAEGKWARGPWSARYELLQGLFYMRTSLQIGIALQFAYIFVSATVQVISSLIFDARAIR